MESRLETVRVYEDERGVFVFICEFCGQLLEGPNSTCNSGAHVGPNGKRKGMAIATVEI